MYYMTIKLLSQRMRMPVLLHMLFLLLLIFSCTRNKADKATDPLDATYTIEDQQIQLHQGKASHPAAHGSAAMIETSIYGRPQYGDLNGDGLNDAVLFLKQDPGGSGSFFYVAAALYEASGWQGTQAMLLGDRIIPNGIEISGRVITVRYLGRRPDEPFSAPATVVMSITLIAEEMEIKTSP